MALDKEDIATAKEMAQTLQKSRNSELIVVGNLLSHLLVERVEPQRTWVGLTWNDVPNEWVGKVAFMEGAKWADKQLKEKNNG